MKEYIIKSMFNGLIIIVVAKSRTQALIKGREHFEHNVNIVSRHVATA